MIASPLAVAVGAAADAMRSRSALLLENALLRHQLAVLNRAVKRPRLTAADRGLLVLLYPTGPTAVFSVHGVRVRRPVPGMPHRVARVVGHGCGQGLVKVRGEGAPLRYDAVA